MTGEIQKKQSSAPNPFLNIFINIVFPAVILNKFSSPERLGPYLGLLVAMSLPILYGAWEFYTTKHHNFISVIGFVSILLTGGLGLLQVDGFWFAVKEASVPALIGIATLVSMKTSKPFVKLMLYNDKVINVTLVDQALDKNNARKGFDSLMLQTTLVLAASFCLSAVLNFWLAIWILKSPAGTPAFNEELGKMTALSYPIIVIPSLTVMMIAVWMLIRGLKKLTGLEMHDIMSDQTKK